MEKIIHFFNNNQKIDPCCGKNYHDFLDYAFRESDYFMLVYVNYYGKGYSYMQKKIKKMLEPYKVKTRTNPRWPGTLETFSQNSTYKVVFYKNVSEAKTILKIVSGIGDWSSPSYPEDLAFFKGNKCWFYSVGHENMAAFINPTKEDLDFLEMKGLADRVNVVTHDSNYYSSYDEELENC